MKDQAIHDGATHDRQARHRHITVLPGYLNVKILAFVLVIAAVVFQPTSTTPLSNFASSSACE